MSPVGSPEYQGFSVGQTVRCTHNDNEDCQACKAPNRICAYADIKGVLGTVMDISDQRIHYFKWTEPDSPHSIMVAFLGGDRPTIIDTDLLAPVDESLMTAEDMQWKWSDQLNELTQRTYKLNAALDVAPDGSNKKFAILSDMEHNSTERRFIESVFAILIP